MAEIETFDEYIQANFKEKLALVKIATGQDLDPREGGDYMGNIEDTYVAYRTKTLAELTNSILALRQLQKNNELNEEAIANVFSQTETLKKAYDRCKGKGYGSWRSKLEGNINMAKERGFKREFTQEEMNALTCDAILKAALRFEDNYSIYIFGTDESAFDTLVQSSKRLFLPTEGYEVCDPKRCKPYEGEGSFLAIFKTGDVGDIDGYGRGGFATLDEWPQNKLLARWHGAGIGAADFTLKLANAIRENGYSAHIDFMGYCNDDVGGVFHDPNWEQKR